MELVLLTAIGVGGATVVGAVIGFLFRNISGKFSSVVLSFAAGVMLAAAVIGLILPALELGGTYKLITTIAGLFTGAIALTLIDKLVPHMHKIIGTDSAAQNNASLNKVLLFVMAIAIHNLPEGLAAGVGFGAGESSRALMIAAGIALQNIPEGMVIIAPMLAAGITPKKTFVAALATGLVEVVGTLIGFFAVSISAAILPFSLAFAGGAMLYVISDEMIPEAHTGESDSLTTHALLVGFSLMLVFDVLFG